MLPDKIEHCIVFMNYWDVSGVFWSFSKCNIKIPHLPTDPSTDMQWSPWTVAGIVAGAGRVVPACWAVVTLTNV